MINISEIKEVLTPLIVVQRYLGQPIKRVNETLWYKSPFRKEKTASFTVSNKKGIHDFGTSEHYDIFSFIQKLYNLSFVESINFLATDFGLNLQDTVLTREQIEKIKEEKNKERVFRENIEKWYNYAFIELCQNKNKLDKLKIKNYDFNKLSKIYNLEVKNNLYLEVFLEVNNYNDKLNLYENERKEVYKLGKRINGEQSKTALL